MNEAGRVRARALIGEPEQASLFDDGTRSQTIAVQLKGVRIENGRQFGNVYLALALWRACRLDEFAAEHIAAGKEAVAWEKMAAVLVAARLCEPSSELHIAEDWYRRTALSDLLQLDENLAWLRESGRRYILGTPKSELRKWAPALADNTHWREIRAGIEVKLCAAPEGDAETFILCRSRDRGEKEKAMHDRFSRRIEQALARLQARIAKSKKRLNRDAINRQIGRLLQRNQRAAARLAIELKHADHPAGCMLEVAVNDRFDH